MDDLSNALESLKAVENMLSSLGSGGGQSNEQPKQEEADNVDGLIDSLTTSTTMYRKCEKCGLDITHDTMEVAGSFMHPECYTCKVCRTPLRGKPSFQEPGTGQFFCEPCMENAVAEEQRRADAEQAAREEQLRLLMLLAEKRKQDALLEQQRKRQQLLQQQKAAALSRPAAAAQVNQQPQPQNILPAGGSMQRQIVLKLDLPDKTTLRIRTQIPILEPGSGQTAVFYFADLAKIVSENLKCDVRTFMPPNPTRKVFYVDEEKDLAYIFDDATLKECLDNVRDLKKHVIRLQVEEAEAPPPARTIAEEEVTPTPALELILPPKDDLPTLPEEITEKIIEGEIQFTLPLSFDSLAQLECLENLTSKKGVSLISSIMSRNSSAKTSTLLKSVQISNSLGDSSKKKGSKKTQESVSTAVSVVDVFWGDELISWMISSGIVTNHIAAERFCLLLKRIGALRPIHKRELKNSDDDRNTRVQDVDVVTPLSNISSRCCFPDEWIPEFAENEEKKVKLLDGTKTPKKVKKDKKEKSLSEEVPLNDVQITSKQMSVLFDFFKFSPDVLYRFVPSDTVTQFLLSIRLLLSSLHFGNMSFSIFDSVSSNDLDKMCEGDMLLREMRGYLEQRNFLIFLKFLNESVKMSSIDCLKQGACDNDSVSVLDVDASALASTVDKFTKIQKTFLIDTAKFPLFSTKSISMLKSDIVSVLSSPSVYALSSLFLGMENEGKASQQALVLQTFVHIQHLMRFFGLFTGVSFDILRGKIDMDTTKFHCGMGFEFPWNIIGDVKFDLLRLIVDEFPVSWVVDEDGGGGGGGGSSLMKRSGSRFVDLNEEQLNTIHEMFVSSGFTFLDVFSDPCLLHSKDSCFDYSSVQLALLNRCRDRLHRVASPEFVKIVNLMQHASRGISLKNGKKYAKLAKKNKGLKGIVPPNSINFFSSADFCEWCLSNMIVQELDDVLVLGQFLLKHGCMYVVDTKSDQQQVSNRFSIGSGIICAWAKDTSVGDASWTSFVSENIRFDEVLSDRHLRKQFTSFIARDYAEENLNFYTECEEFCSLVVDEFDPMSKVKVAEEAIRLFNEYVSPSSKTQINLPSTIINELVKYFSKRSAKFSRWEQDGRFIADFVFEFENHATIFEEALLSIYEMMRRDVFPRYMKQRKMLDDSNASNIGQIGN